jgi:hypothetical protein
MRLHVMNVTAVPPHAQIVATTAPEELHVALHPLVVMVMSKVG